MLRGITIAAMILVNTPGSWSYVYPPLLHSTWNGCTPTDMVFPFFLFMVGISMSFSFRKYEYQFNREAISKVIRRTFLIFVIGLALNIFPFYDHPIGQWRIMGVLQRIALCYGFGALLVLLFRKGAVVLAGILLLLLYWGLLYFGVDNEPYGLENNLSRQLDLIIFGENHVYQGYGIPFDPEGLLSTISSTVNVLIGYLIGRRVIELSSHQQKVKEFLIAGIILIILGKVWDFVFPINKPIWTSSYVVYTCGIASVLFAFLIWLIDIKGWKKWSFFFKVYGMNALFAYILSGIFVKILIRIPIGELNGYSWLYEQVFVPIAGNLNGSLLFAISFNIFVWLFIFWLYRKRIFIKI